MENIIDLEVLGVVVHISPEPSDGSHYIFISLKSVRRESGPEAIEGYAYAKIPMRILNRDKIFKGTRVCAVVAEKSEPIKRDDYPSKYQVRQHGGEFDLKPGTIFHGFSRRNTADIDGLQNESKSISRRLEELNTEKNDLEEALNKIKGQRDKLDQDVKENNAILTNVRREIDNCKDELKKCKDEVEKIKSDRNKLHSATSEQAEILGHQIAKLEKAWDACSKIYMGVELPAKRVFRWEPEPLTTPRESENERQFIERLSKNIDYYTPYADQQSGENWHASLLHCKISLIPHLGYVKAYQETMGPSIWPMILYAKPTWLSFSDALGDGLGEIVEQAHRLPGHLVIGVVRSFNLSLPECWMQPILDIAAGYADYFPGVFRGWPSNLRFVLIPAHAEIGLRWQFETGLHFAAAVAGNTPTGDKKSISVHKQAGHVPRYVWDTWIRTGPEHSVKAEGHWGRFICSDIANLKKYFSSRGFHDAENRARNIRIEWPSGYLPGKKLY